MNLEWFSDEPVAARALENHVHCIASGSFERRKDRRGVKIIAALVVEGCVQESAALHDALADVFDRKPELLPAGSRSMEAATEVVADANSRVEAIILEGRGQ